MTDPIMDESNLDLVDDLLTREQAIANLMAPTGYKLVILKNPSNHMCRIAWNDARVKLPKELEGEWTSMRIALEEANAYLKKFWDMSDAATAKSLRRNSKAAEAA